jgi:hypothetical protein
MDSLPQELRRDFARTLNKGLFAKVQCQKVYTDMKYSQARIV